MNLPLLHDLALALEDAYTGDCTRYAEEIARRLLDAGHTPWIGAVREVVVLPDGRTDHAPLIPLKYAARNPPVWTVHYVGCSGEEAFEPMLGEPVSVDDFADRVFGRNLPVRKVIPEEDTVRLLRSGALREQMKTLRWR